MNQSDTDDDAADAFHSPTATDNEKTPQASPTSGQLRPPDQLPPAIALPPSVREEDEGGAAADPIPTERTAAAKKPASTRRGFTFPTMQRKKKAHRNRHPGDNAGGGGGGWAGWGSFLSSAVSAVAESLQSDVDSFVDTAKGVQTELAKTAEKTVDRVYTVLDAKDGAGEQGADADANDPADSDAPVQHLE